MARSTAGGTDPLAAGRAALERAAWDEARTIFEEATAAGGGAEAWEGLAQAVWWKGDVEATLAAHERAYRAYRDAGDAHAAARMAMWLCSDYFDLRGDVALAEAWLRRGIDLLDGLEPCVDSGWITLWESNIALLAKDDPGTARERAEVALELARELGDSGVEMVALTMIGSAMVAVGDVGQGLERLERSVSLAVGEDCSDRFAPGWTFCHTVTACTGIGDFARAAQWCAAMHAWSTEWPARQFFGVCRTAYGEVLTARGDWPTAEQELMSALDNLEPGAPSRAVAAIRLGKLRVRQGDTAEARTLFESALPMPQAIVCLGELDLDEGDTAAAADAAERVLRRLGDEPVLDRFPAIELLARARAAAGDAEGAIAAADELEADADRIATPHTRGRAALVRAEALMAADDHEGARRAAEDAADLFVASGAPYEAARARLLLARALDALGRVDRGEAEARSARQALDSLRAVARETAGTRAELTLREVEILRLVANGESDAEIAARLYLSPHTVHRHVANIRTKLRAPSRAAAVAQATRAELL